MSFASKYNKGRKFNINTTGFGYISLSDLYNANGKNCVYPLYAIYINTKGKYADNPVFVTEISGSGYFVNVPAHMTDTARAVLLDGEAINAINAHKVGFIIYKYHENHFNRDCLSVEFRDI